MPAPPRIAVLDLGTGNLRSVAKALEGVGLDPEVTADPDGLRGAGGVVLPGVGNFNTAAANLRAKGLDQALVELRGEGRPYLGICLGLQLLFDEGDAFASIAGARNDQIETAEGSVHRIRPRQRHQPVLGGFVAIQRQQDFQALRPLQRQVHAHLVTQ